MELFIFILGMVSLYYIGGPLLVKQTMWIKRYNQLIPMSLESLPLDVQPFFIQTGNGLLNLGFKPVKYFYNQGQTTHCNSHYSLWVNEASKDIVVIADILADNGISKQRVPYIEFVTDFTDGSDINTNNSSQPSVFPKLPNKETFSLPDIYDPYTLYFIHNNMVQRYGKDKIKILPQQEQYEFYLHKSNLDALEQREKIGYLYLDRKEDKYRPTLLGAYLMSWRIIWPINKIQLALMKKEAKVLVNQINK